MLTFDGQWHAGEVCSSRRNPSYNCTRQMADSVYGVVWGSAQSAQWWRWGYGMDNEHNSILSVVMWMHRNTVTRSWGPLSCHLSAVITSCFSMIMQGPMSQRSVTNSWKLKMSQFFHGLHTHQTCHPLSTFVMLWTDVSDSFFQVTANIQQLRTAIDEEWDNIPQSTAWSTLCEGDVVANDGHTRYWLVFWSTPLPFLKGFCD